MAHQSGIAASTLPAKSLAMPIPLRPLNSPLRYPGGKSRLANFLAGVIDCNDLKGREYFEPFAGGGGAALSLLSSGAVSAIHLNDADRRIFSFWRAVLDETDQFVERILQTPLTVNEWLRQRAICRHPRNHSRLEIGFAVFYLNRCNRSGVVDSAGPIGGKKQLGRWKIDVRFNRATLAERVADLGKQRDAIFVTNRDAIQFLKKKLPKGHGRSNVFVYLDPPYVDNSRRLYWNSYDQEGHRELSLYMESQRCLPWLMSYDDSSLVRGLYRASRVTTRPIRYSLQVKRSSQELIVTPKYLRVPAQSPVINSRATSKTRKIG